MAPRPAETAAVDDFLRSSRREAAALVLEGEPGIGKSTLLISAIEQARRLNYQVLVAWPAQAESVLAYAALTDLLGDVDDAAWAELPPAQRHAVDRVMLWDDTTGPATDRRAVAAGFLTLVEILADRGPLLIVIDDAQWLDPSSAHVVAFAARRLPAAARILVTVRSGSAAATDWLHLPATDAVRRLEVKPLSLGGLHAVVSERLGRTFPRPAMARIQSVSGGNPFYAIELARAMSGAGADAALPSTLSELVRDRVGELDATLHECLLAAACLAAPTVDVVARAVGRDPAIVVDLLREAESKGLVDIEGTTMRFAHPLLARGVYTDAPPGRRRRMHRRLADIVEQPELRARHLAMAATTVDQRTLQALDEAAESARTRGAPDAAAEFTDLAISLGGDTPERRVRSAAMHFNAGDSSLARATLEQTVTQVPPGPARAEALRLLGVVLLFADSFVESATVLEDALTEAGDDVAARVPILITLAFALVNGGQLVDALARAQTAIDDATRLGDGNLLSQALSMNEVLRFIRGDGYDEEAMRRAVDLEDPNADTPVAFRPRAQYALLQAWTGNLDVSRRELSAIRARCMERGEESDLIFVAFHQVLAEIWAGDLPAAALLVEDFVERAMQLGTDLPLAVALTTRALMAAYGGRADEARADAAEALAAGRRCSSTRLSEWPVTAIGFLHVSLGEHRAALDALTPLLVIPEMAPDATEVIGATFIPDAVEAMIRIGDLDRAEELTDLLQRNGARLDRPWTSAVGARCRALLLAARGDVEGAARSAETAMSHHDRLPMPFERARTQLLLGQLHRRRRHKDAASVTLKEALATFEQLGIPLWAERARGELGRANVGPRRTGGLTPSEQRVAELAATGMTNREVATALFISPKTVEANLARIYRKLGIRSRAELGRVTPLE